jgi:hypothetical protein
MTKLLVRLSDNVLEDDDWPVRRIEIQEKVIVGVEDIQQGVYGTGHMPDVGWGLSQLVGWLSYDGTGQHPENYHEIKAQTDEKYEPYVSTREDLANVIRRAEREAA